MKKFGRLAIGLCGTLFLLAWLSASVAGADCTASYGNGTHHFSVATGSPGELGLLEVLAEAFNSSHDSTLCWIKAGSGESLKMLKEKKTDMIMVHAPDAEKKAVREGWAVQRTLIGSNEFYLVGPQDDPAHIAEAKSAAEAYKRIADAGAKFLSRGDNSGTHTKEMSVWKTANIKPSGDWYIVTGTFMTATLKKADEVRGYFMTDSSTWVSAKKEMKNLKILFRGDMVLINTYNALCQPEGATPGQTDAAKFIEFVASEQGQKIIREYGKTQYGDGLYNDAAYAKQYDR